MCSTQHLHRHLVLLTLCLSLGLGLSPALEAGGPLLSGRVLEQIGGKNLPLDQARVELLLPHSNEVRYHCYTDSKGIYAFRGVQPGTYQIRVRLGERVLAQVDKGGEVQPVRRVHLPSQPSRLEIIVRGIWGK